MTSTEIPIRMMCWPGPRAAAGLHTTRSGQLVLAMFLDPMNIVVAVPPFPDAAIPTASFLRQLASSASSLAARLDPWEPSTGMDGGAHRADGTGRAGLPPGGDRT